MFLSQVFIAQGYEDSDPCGDSGHCVVFELKHLEPSLFPHPCAETPTCAILIETKALLWGVWVWVLSSIFDENNERGLKKFNPVLTIIYRPIAYEHRPTRGRSTAVEPVIQAPAVPHV